MPGEHDYQRPIAPPGEAHAWHEIFDSLPYPIYIIDAVSGEPLMANAPARQSGLAPYYRLLTAPEESPKKGPSASLLDTIVQGKKPLVIEHIDYGPTGRPAYMKFIFSR